MKSIRLALLLIISANISIAQIVGLSPFADICENGETIILSGGTPAGGTYLINGTVGSKLNPSVFGAGVHNITYSYTDTTGTYDTIQSIVVNAAPVVFIATFDVVCSDYSEFNLISGSPMGGIINNIRGIHVLVPRNMTKAAGFYNTLLRGDDPALVIECLNGYRLKETVPANINEFTVPLGMPEIVRAGADITIVSYGSTLRIVEDAAIRLAAMGIDCEVIDVQTLLPFDINHQIVASLKKTNRILFVDEDVPGGATAYMYQQVIEIQGGYKWLDASARTLSAKAHRPAYASDGDYFSKPNTEEVIQVVKDMIAE